MKFLMILSAMVSSAAMAASPQIGDSWSSIRSNSSVLNIEQPATASAFGADGLFNACVSGDTIQSIAPVKTCVAQKLAYMPSGTSTGGVTYPVCTAWDFETASVAIYSAQQVCLKSHTGYIDGAGNEGPGQALPIEICDEYGTQTVAAPTSFGLPVIGKGGQTFCNQTDGPATCQDIGKFLFTKNLTLPACEK